nr:hypothetical protein [Tanacetum cinerariifolium]
INLHTIRDDSLLVTLKFVSKTQDYQQYGALIPDDVINQDIKDSQAYKTYYEFPIGKVPARKARKYKKVASLLRKLSPIQEAEPVKKGKRVKRTAKESTIAPTVGVVLRDTPGVPVLKKKAPAKGDRSKGIEILFDVALSKAAQLKEVTKRSKKDFHNSQVSSSGDGTNLESEIPDEQQHKTSGDSEDDSDDDSKGDDDKTDSDDDGNSDADDNERTNLDDDDENPSFTLKDYDEEEHDEEYESDDDYDNMFEEEDDDDLYKDVDMRSRGTEHEKQRQGDEEMTNVGQNVSQELLYKQVVEDAHVTLIALQKTDDSKKISSISSDFASKFLILENVPPTVDEVASMLHVKSRQEESSTQAPSFLIFDKRMSTLETELSQLKQADLSTQLLKSIKSQLPTMVDDLLSTIIRYATRTTLESYTKDVEKKGQEERKLYIDVVKKLVKDIIKDEVKSLLSQILPKEVLDFATLMIQSTITESLKNVMLAKSSSQPQSTYEAAPYLIEFELKKILIDKLEKSKSYRAAKEHKDLYGALIKSYQLDKDLFDSYGKAYSLKRICDDKDNDEDPPAGSDQGLEKKKTSKDVEPPKGSKSKESKTSSSRGTKSQSKSSRKSMQAEEPVFETADTKMPQDQRGNTEEQPNVKATRRDDWFKKPERTPTPDPEWKKPPLTFDELMSTPIDFSAYVMHNLKIDNLTQEILIGPAFNLLKGTCKSFVELEYHFEECYKAVTDQIDWNNPEGHKYLFDLKVLAENTQLLQQRPRLLDMIIYKASKTWFWSYGVQKRIIVVTHVKVVKWNGYGYSEDIIIRREDQSLHKFKEGDFPRLNLHDIKDLQLLLV